MNVSDWESPRTRAEAQIPKFKSAKEGRAFFHTPSAPVLFWRCNVSHTYTYACSGTQLARGKNGLACTEIVKV